MHIGALHMRRSFWISHPKFHKSANGFEGIFHGVENHFRLRNPAQEMLYFGKQQPSFQKGILDPSKTFAALTLKSIWSHNFGRVAQ